MKVINYRQKSSNLDVAGFLDKTPLYISVPFRKDSKIFNRYAQKQWCCKGVLWNSYSKTSKTLSKVGIFLKLKLWINEKSADLVADFQNTGNSKKRFLLLSYVQISKLSKHNSKHIFPILRHFQLSRTTFKKTKKTIRQITVTYI